MKSLRLVVSMLLLSLCVSCSHPGQFRDSYLTDFHEGHFEEADTTLSQRIEKTMPNGSYAKNKDAVWLLLERATVRFVQGQAADAADDYRLALEAMDYYQQDMSAEKVAQLIVHDASEAYAGTQQEALLARIYFALALHQIGDSSNSGAILRQAEDWQQTQMDRYRDDPDRLKLAGNALAKYLLMAQLDQEGDHSNAELLYSQATAYVQNESTLRLPLAPPSRCDKREQAQVLVLTHSGNIPVRVSDEFPAAEALGFATELMLLSDSRDVAVSSMAPVMVPRLAPVLGGEARAVSIQVDSHSIPSLPLLNLAGRSAEELELDFPSIAGRAIARRLLRRGAVLAAQKSDSDLGALTDLFMLVANHNTEADIRSWSTLPSQISVSSASLLPGRHELQVDGHSTPVLNLRANDLCIINVFHTHPGVVSILIPERYLLKGDQS